MRHLIIAAFTVSLLQAVCAELGTFCPPGESCPPGPEPTPRSPCYLGINIGPNNVCHCDFFVRDCAHTCPRDQYQLTAGECLLDGCPCVEGVTPVLKPKPGRCPRYRPYRYIYRRELDCERDEDCMGTKKCCSVSDRIPLQCLPALAIL